MSKKSGDVSADSMQFSAQLVCVGDVSVMDKEEFPEEPCLLFTVSLDDVRRVASCSGIFSKKVKLQLQVVEE